MEIVMGKLGRRLVQFIDYKIREEKAKDRHYTNRKFAERMSIPPTSLQGWLDKGEIERIDVDNFWTFINVFGQEFIDWMNAPDT